VPDKIGQHSEIAVNAEMVKSKLAGIVKNRDLSEYIL
jgi:ATP-dependent HslUV protease ATP-binding subunit HslU